MNQLPRWTLANTTDTHSVYRFRPRLISSPRCYFHAPKRRAPRSRPTIPLGTARGRCARARVGRVRFFLPPLHVVPGGRDAPISPRVLPEATVQALAALWAEIFLADLERRPPPLS